MGREWELRLLLFNIQITNPLFFMTSWDEEGFGQNKSFLPLKTLLCSLTSAARADVSILIIMMTMTMMIIMMNPCPGVLVCIWDATHLNIYLCAYLSSLGECVRKLSAYWFDDYQQLCAYLIVLSPRNLFEFVAFAFACAVWAKLKCKYLLSGGWVLFKYLNSFRLIDKPQNFH